MQPAVRACALAVLLVNSCAANDRTARTHVVVQTDVSSVAQLGGCKAAGTATVRRIDQRTISFCGMIDSGSVARVSDVLRTEDEAIVISSVGGSISAPLDLARLVKKEGLTVVVDGPCFSGCAAFVFATAQERLVNPNSILGFHNTSTSASELLAASIMADQVDAFTPLFARADSERRLYFEAGLDAAFLLEPQLRVKTVCIELAGVHPISGERILNISSEYSLWAPSPERLQNAGMRYSGSLPASLSEVEKRLQSEFGIDGGGYSFVFGGEPISDPHREIQMLANECRSGTGTQLRRRFGE